jgi:hypothetical protein
LEEQVGPEAQLPSASPCCLQMNVWESFFSPNTKDGAQGMAHPRQGKRSTT